MPLHHTVEDRVIQTHHIDFDAGTGATTSFPAIPADGMIMQVIVVLFTAFDAAASVEVGTSGDADQFVASSDLDLTFAQPQPLDVYALLASETTPILSFSANGATVGSGRVIITYVEAS